jgi:hypothetical protein
MIPFGNIRRSHKEKERGKMWVFFWGGNKWVMDTYFDQVGWFQLIAHAKYISPQRT